jgi:hypothetical protein
METWRQHTRDEAEAPREERQPDAAQATSEELKAFQDEATHFENEEIKAEIRTQMDETGDDEEDENEIMQTTGATENLNGDREHDRNFAVPEATEDEDIPRTTDMRTRGMTKAQKQRKTVERRKTRRGRTRRPRKNVPPDRCEGEQRGEDEE